MKIEVGKTYINRSGELVGPMCSTSDLLQKGVPPIPHRPVYFETWSYLETGHFNASRVPHFMDLIEEFKGGVS